MSDLLDRKSAVISPCGTYRYQLGRRWGEGAAMLFVMLNPSTADAEIDDPTIRRCVGFAKREGLAGIDVMNLFAFRSPSPSEMRRAADPVGPDNDDFLARMFLAASAWGAPVVAAWGAHGFHKGRDAKVYALAKGQGVLMQCLGVTNGGAPKHPLYLPADAPLIEWSPLNLQKDDSQ